METEKLNKNSIPQDFSISLAIVDSIPVIFFGINCVLLGIDLKSVIFVIGAILCFLAGMGKVIWKIIAATKKKNIWPLFVQLRILMPLGFLLIILGIIFNRANIDFEFLWRTITQMPKILFLILGVLGMILMTIFAFVLDNSKIRSNWIEQITNSISQISFFILILMFYSF